MSIRKLDQKQVAYIIRERKKNTSSKTIATRVGVTPRRVYQIYAYYVKTGDIPTRRKIGRPKREPTQKEIKIVTKMYSAVPQGVNRLTRQLQADQIQISHDIVRKIMKAKGLSPRALAKKT